MYCLPQCIVCINGQGLLLFFSQHKSANNVFISRLEEEKKKKKQANLALQGPYSWLFLKKNGRGKMTLAVWLFLTFFFSSSRYRYKLKICQHPQQSSIFFN